MHSHRNRIRKKRDEDEYKKVISAVAFVAIAMVTGSIVSIYRMDRSLAEARNAAQVEIADTVQEENEKMVRTEIRSVVQTEQVAFSCEISGCTETEVHQHGLCGIDSCTQIGEPYT